MACAGWSASSLAVRGVEKWSRFGLGPVDAGVSSSGVAAVFTRVGEVGLKKVWIGGDPLVPAPRHFFRKLAELMMRRLLSRCNSSALFARAGGWDVHRASPRRDSPSKFHGCTR